MRPERLGNRPAAAHAPADASTHSQQARPAQLTAHAPPGRRAYVIGDVHGHIGLLRRLAHAIADDLREQPVDDASVVFLGDLIDRGPNSRDCVKAAMGLPIVDGVSQFAVLGNHEEYMLRALRQRDFKRLASWMCYGGAQTLLSYGLDEATIDGFAEFPEAYADIVAAAAPETHLDWIEGLPRMIAFGDYVLVHAGVRPGVALDKQDPHDLVWIREPFLSTETPLPGRVVVHGHTPTKHIALGGDRICIDSGAAYGGPLTALVLEAETRRLIQVRP